MIFNKKKAYRTLVPYPYEYTWLYAIRGHANAVEFFEENLEKDYLEFCEGKAYTAGQTLQFIDEETGTRFYVIVLPEEYDDIFTRHEVEHFTLYVMEDIDFAITAANSEPFNYLNDYIQREIKIKLYEIADPARLNPDITTKRNTK